MKIALVTDEVSADPETAIELGVKWGIHNFEIRGFGKDRVPEFSDFQKVRLMELLEGFDARVVAISPGLFKCPYPRGSRERFPLRTFDYNLHQQWRGAQEVLRYHLEELLPRSIEYAHELGAEIIVSFGFDRGDAPAGEAPEAVLVALRDAAEQVSAAGLRLAIEVEAGFWADTGARTAAIVEAVDHPALRVNWDPGNAFEAGDIPYPDGYRAVREYVQHVHFKDVRRKADGTFEYVVHGDIDWAGQIEALIRDGYDGYVSVETHMEPKVRSARAVTERLRDLIDVATER